MTGTHPTTKAGGICLALGAGLFLFTIPAFVFLFGAPEGTGPDGAATIADQAAHMLSKATTIRTIWLVEAAAVLGLCLAGFALSRREARSMTYAPFGWLAVGIGSLVYLTMYAMVLGAYWPAAEVASRSPAILDAANEAAVATFLIANVPINLGIGIAMAVEARHEGRRLWKTLAGITSFCATVSGLFMGYALVIDGGMETALMAAPLGGILFILLVIFGVRFARHG